MIKSQFSFPSLTTQQFSSKCAAMERQFRKYTVSYLEPIDDVFHNMLNVNQF